MAIYFDSLATDLAALCVALLCVFVAYFKLTYTYWWRRGLYTATTEVPFGSMKLFLLQKRSWGFVLKDIYKEIKSANHKHGGFFLIAKPIYMPVDPDLIRLMTTKDFPHFTDRGLYYNEKDDPLSANLFSLPGPEWKPLRTKFTPTFSSGKMKMMFQTLVDCSAGLKNVINEAIDSNEAVDIRDVTGRYTIDTIGSCAFGVECNSLKNPEVEFNRYSHKIFRRTTFNVIKEAVANSFPNVMKLLGSASITSDISEFFINVVNQTVAYRENNNVVRNDFMHLLLQLKNPESGESDLSMKELAAQCWAFYSAGFETAAATMTFCLHELAVNVDVQDKLREQIVDVLKKNEGELTYESVMEMPYLDKVVSETLRKHPSVPHLLRECTKDYKVPETDFVIRKGEAAFISVLGLHHDPEYFPNPEVFDPERFNEENKATRHPYVYIPFGEGPRICIALRFGLMQTKVGLVALLSNFKFTLDARTKKDIEMDPRSFLSRGKDISWLRAEKV